MQRTNWRVVGASVQGESHRRQGQPCQDAHRWQDTSSGVLVATVADGAGSASCSEIGSALAAQAGVHEAVQRLRLEVPRRDDDWRSFLRHVFQVTRRDVVTQAEGLDIAPVEMATTLLVVVVTPERLVAGQIGDGAVVVRRPDATFQAVTWPCGQEYINETTFLTSPDYLDKVQFIVQAGPITGLAVFTDGLQMLALKMPQASPHAAFFTPLLQLLAATPERDQAEEQLRGFLQSPRISERADDDLTLVLAVRDEGTQRS